VGVEPAKGRAAIARPEPHPSDHVRDEGAPPAAARFLRGGAEPEVSAVEQFEAGGLEEHAAHFPATFSVAAPDGEESVIAELLTRVRFPLPAGFYIPSAL
jgi:hypothetical protein